MWTCQVCSEQNNDSLNKCATCGSARKLHSEKASSSALLSTPPELEPDFEKVLAELEKESTIPSPSYKAYPIKAPLKIWEILVLILYNKIFQSVVAGIVLYVLFHVFVQGMIFRVSGSGLSAFIDSTIRYGSFPSRFMNNVIMESYILGPLIVVFFLCNREVFEEEIFYYSYGTFKKWFWWTFFTIILGLAFFFAFRSNAYHLSRFIRFQLYTSYSILGVFTILIILKATKYRIDIGRIELTLFVFLILNSVLFFSANINSSLSILYKLRAASAIAMTTTGFAVVVMASQANVRSGPSTKSRVITVASHGEKYDTVKKIGEWYQLRHRSSTGEAEYIHQNVVIRERDFHAEQVQVQRSWVNIRSKPSMKGSVVAHGKRGQVLPVLGRNGDWYKVRLLSDITGQAEIGFVHRNVVSSD